MVIGAGFDRACFLPQGKHDPAGRCNSTEGKEFCCAVDLTVPFVSCAALQVSLYVKQ